MGSHLCIYSSTLRASSVTCRAPLPVATIGMPCWEYALSACLQWQIDASMTAPGLLSIMYCTRGCQTVSQCSHLWCSPLLRCQAISEGL